MTTNRGTTSNNLGSANSGRARTFPKPAASSYSKDNWLMGDPITWRGRKIRSRRSGTVYTVRQVYLNGRVELEKNWMTYTSNTESIRQEYDAYL